VSVRLGLCTWCFGDVSLPEALRWVGQSGFESVEIQCPPVRSESSWYQGSGLNVGGLTGPSRDAFMAALDEAGLRASALVWYTNLLERDERRRDAAWEHLGRIVDAAATLGIEVVGLTVGRDPAAPLGDCLAEFARRAKPLVARAEAGGVKLAVENDPMCGREFEDLPGNAAFCPQLWENLFAHIRSPALGLAFDPAHLVWLGIDPVTAATDYAEKIFHVQANDVEIFEHRRQDCSVMRPSGGWFRYRIPGFGAVDWRRLLDRLRELGYTGAVCVEQQDPVWQGSLDRIKEGAALARRHLVQFLP
jgi:sugar phosphate isomerase/epimerase